MTSGYDLLRPGNRYPSRLPGLTGGHVVKLVTPRRVPARFSQLLFVLDADGAGTGTPLPCEGQQSFLYAFSGTAQVEAAGEALTLAEGGYAYLPTTAETLSVRAVGGPAEVVWLRKSWQAHPGVTAPPAVVTGHRDDEAYTPIEPAGLTRRELIDPEDPAFDFNMSLLRFEPGTTLGKTEVHDEEHGLLMTAGRGVYELGPDRVDVARGDFVYMAPYCPQGFVAGGDDPAEYLLYKDRWRL